MTTRAPAGLTNKVCDIFIGKSRSRYWSFKKSIFFVCLIKAHPWNMRYTARIKHQKDEISTSWIALTCFTLKGRARGVIVVQFAAEWEQHMYQISQINSQTTSFHSLWCIQKVNYRTMTGEIKGREGQKNIPDAEHVVPELASRILQIAPLLCWIELVTPTLLLSLAYPWTPWRLKL